MSTSVYSSPLASQNGGESGLSSLSSSSPASKPRTVTHSACVSKNRANENAIQINGHIAGKIYNLSFETLIVHCRCASASNSARIPSRVLAPTQREICNKTKILDRTNVNIVSKAEMMSLPRQNVRVRTRTTDSPHAICVVHPRKVADSFIAHEITRRLGLRLRENPSLKRSLLWGSTELVSTGEYVELAFTSSGSTPDVAHFFHVVEDCPFDLLLGQDLANNRVLRREESGRVNPARSRGSLA